MSRDSRHTDTEEALQRPKECKYLLSTEAFERSITLIPILQ